jgi:hypothetical protein
MTMNSVTALMTPHNTINHTATLKGWSEDRDQRLDPLKAVPVSGRVYLLTSAASALEWCAFSSFSEVATEFMVSSVCSRVV